MKLESSASLNRWRRPRHHRSVRVRVVDIRVRIRVNLIHQRVGLELLVLLLLELLLLLLGGVLGGLLLESLLDGLLLESLDVLREGRLLDVLDRRGQLLDDLGRRVTTRASALGGATGRTSIGLELVREDRGSTSKTTGDASSLHRNRNVGRKRRRLGNLGHGSLLAFLRRVAILLLAEQLDMHMHGAIVVLDKLETVEEGVTIKLGGKLVHDLAQERDALFVVAASFRRLLALLDLRNRLNAGNSLRMILHDVHQGFLLELVELRFVHDEGMESMVTALHVRVHRKGEHEVLARGRNTREKLGVEVIARETPDLEADADTAIGVAPNVHDVRETTLGVAAVAASLGHVLALLLGLLVGRLVTDRHIVKDAVTGVTKPETRDGIGDVLEIELSGLAVGGRTGHAALERSVLGNRSEARSRKVGVRVDG